MLTVPHFPFADFKNLNNIFVYYFNVILTVLITFNNNTISLSGIFGQGILSSGFVLIFNLTTRQLKDLFN